MCERDDNKTGWEPLSWLDPVDNVLMGKVWPTLVARHGGCTPSNTCLVDAVTCYLENDAPQAG